MSKSLDADVSEHWVKPVKISLLEQAIAAAFTLDRIKASPKATRVSNACNALAWLTRLWTRIVEGDREPTYTVAPIRNYLQNNMESSGTKAQAQRTQTAYGDLVKALSKSLGGAPGGSLT